MLFLKQKIQNYFDCQTLDSSSCGAVFLSLFIHAIIFFAIFGFFVANKNEYNYSTPLIVISMKEFQDLQSEKQISNNKKFGKKSEEKIIAKNEGDSAKKLENGEENFSQNQQNIQYNSYVNLIANELERRKSRFSMSAAPNDVKVEVVFKVKFDANGNLQSYEMAKHSGYDFFDKIATKILTCKKSFPIPPKEIMQLGLEFSIPIIFDSLT